MPRKSNPKPWYHDGLAFDCTACGKCCWAHDGYAHVYVNDAESAAIAKTLGVAFEAFEREYTQFDDEGLRELRFVDGHCVFLKEGKCSVYAARPVQCKTWPFWPETLKQRVWREEVVPFCPGTEDAADSPHTASKTIRTRDEIERQAAAMARADRDGERDAERRFP
jgi:Fe-S-cluster containining protein